MSRQADAVPREPYRPRDLQWKVFRGTDAIARGLITRDNLRTAAWRRLLRDVYADARLDPDHLLACQAVALAMPASAVIAGPSAAWLLGVEFAAEPTDDVHVLRPHGVTFDPSRGVRTHAAALTREEITERQGLACTSPSRTVWDTACWLELIHAVVIIDGLLAIGRVTADELALLVKAKRGVRGGRKLARAVSLSDEGARSPAESRIRVRLVLAGLPRPVTQYEIRVPGLVLHPDLAWPQYKVALEYDGDYHRDPDVLHPDRRRLNLLTGAGWIMLYATSQRLRRDFGALVREVETALRRRGWRAHAKVNTTSPT